MNLSPFSKRFFLEKFWHENLIGISSLGSQLSLGKLTDLFHYWIILLLVANKIVLLTRTEIFTSKMIF